MRFASFQLPPEPRSFPGRRGLKVFLRALHVLSAGVFTGAHVLAVEAPAPTPWLLATIGTGLAILLLDLGAFLLQVRGLLVLASVVFSHAPSKVRYFVVFGRGWVEGAETKG